MESKKRRQVKCARPAIVVPRTVLRGAFQRAAIESHLCNKRQPAPKPSEIVVYPNAGHGFNADYRPGYNKRSPAGRMKRLQKWFKKYGAA